MNVFQATENLVQEVANVVVAQFLCLQQFVHICLHQALNNVAVSEVKEQRSSTNAWASRVSRETFRKDTCLKLAFMKSEKHVQAVFVTQKDTRLSSLQLWPIL